MDKKNYDVKREFIIFLSLLLSDWFISVGGTQILLSSNVRGIGVVFDQYLTFNYHISGIFKSTHFHLSSIATFQLLMLLHHLFMPLYSARIL